jgi:thiamine-monophosphate kinase
MKLSDLGERRIIQRLSSFLSIGDDAAYIPVDGKYLVLSTDVIYEATHILPGMTFEQVGRFVASVNLSDIASMGATPFAFLLAYAGPDLRIDAFESIIHGVDRQCKKYGVDYVGGDTKYADRLTLAGTAAGFVKKPVLRSGARVGDVVAVTGTLGGAAYGIDCLLSGKECTKKLVKKATEPQPRVKEGILLGKHASAMTDISDGLSVSLHDLSGSVGIRVDLDAVPLEKDLIRLVRRSGAEPLKYAVSGGGDYELLFTMSEKSFAGVQKKVGATAIGKVVEGKGVSAFLDGEEFILPKTGYQHFRKE